MQETENDKTISPRLLSVDQLADYLGISPRTIYNGISRKTKKPFPIKCKRLMSKPMFDVKEVNAYIDAL